MQQPVEVSDIMQGRASVPVSDYHLTQQLVSYLPPLHIGSREGAGLDHPGKEQLQGGHEGWQRGCGLAGETDAAVCSYLEERRT